MNILTEALIRIETRDGIEWMSLPGVYAALVADRVASFPALRPHQVPAWHMFLAQLGAIAVHRAGLPEPPADAETWQRIIRALTVDEFPGDEPWCLVVEDSSMPAFLQPPVPEGSNFTKSAETPDALDMLVTAKNHDLKTTIATNCNPEDWLFALVTQQTFDGALTPNPKSLQLGISRMNSGDGSRPFIGLAPLSEARTEPRWGAHIYRDIGTLAQSRAAGGLQASDASGVQPIALTWIARWSGSNVFALHKLDPLFIEICRVIRLKTVAGSVVAQRAGSPSRRVDGTAYRGVTGDPWAPVNLTPTKSQSNPKGDPVVLTINSAGFGYALMAKLLFDDEKYSHPQCMTLGSFDQKTDGPLAVVARCLVRKQSGTEGYVERIVPFGKLGARRALGARKPLKALSQHQIAEIDQLSDALKDAVGVFRRGGIYWREVPADRKKSERQKQEEAAALIVTRLQTGADRLFFPSLWERFEAEEERDESRRNTARKTFVIELRNIATALLDEALADLPCPSMRRPRAEARARQQFRSRLRRGFPEYFAIGAEAEDTAHAL